MRRHRSSLPNPPPWFPPQPLWYRAWRTARLLGILALTGVAVWAVITLTIHVTGGGA
jgi:hypothetical protein